VKILITPAERQRQRYATDPAFRQRMIDNAKSYRLKYPERVREQKQQYVWKNRDARNEYHNKLREQRVLEVFEALGNQCMTCGFDKLPALQIHHKDGMKLHKRDWLKKGYDLNRVELLCANCHAMVTYQDNKYGVTK
jgi:predicted HNH restriction endonuclease